MNPVNLHNMLRDQLFFAIEDKMTEKLWQEKPSFFDYEIYYVMGDKFETIFPVKQIIENCDKK